MSVSLKEIITASGYDLTDRDDLERVQSILSEADDLREEIDDLLEQIYDRENQENDDW